jgi:hypothetical protein
LRIGSALGLTIVLWVAFELLKFEPHPGRLALMTCVCVAFAWLIGDGLVEPGPSWKVPLQPQRIFPPGADRRVGVYAGILESHRTSAEPDANLRDRLADLTDRRLLQRLGLTRSHPTAREILGEDLLAVVEGPPRRLTTNEVDRLIRRIEEL